MSKIFGIHFAMHDDAGCLHQWVPGDPVPVWAASRVGDHCLEVEVAADELGDDQFMRPADEDEDDKGEDVAEDPAEPAADAASLDFTAPAKPKATRGRPAKKA